MKKTLLAALFACSPLWAIADVLPHAELSVGIHRIDAEVAATDESRMVGLMYRKTMPDAHGMLFIFDSAGSHCMWMKNTLLPLSVAFVDDAGKIVNVEEMAPETEDSHCAAQPVRYALEMNRGWFQSRGVKKGARLSGLPRPH